MGWPRLILALLFLLLVPSQAHALKVLWIGNSMTYGITTVTDATTRYTARVEVGVSWLVEQNAGCGTATIADFIEYENEDPGDDVCYKRWAYYHPTKGISTHISDSDIVHLQFGVVESTGSGEPCIRWHDTYSDGSKLCVYWRHRIHGALQAVIDQFPATQRFVISMDPHPYSSVFSAGDVTDVGSDGKNRYDRMVEYEAEFQAFAAQRPNVCFGVNHMLDINPTAHPEYWTPGTDQVHPNAAGHQAMADAIAARLQVLFDASGPLIGGDPCMGAVPDGQFFFRAGP